MDDNQKSFFFQRLIFSILIPLDFIWLHLLQCIYTKKIDSSLDVFSEYNNIWKNVPVSRMEENPFNPQMRYYVEIKTFMYKYQNKNERAEKYDIGAVFMRSE